MSWFNNKPTRPDTSNRVIEPHATPDPPVRDALVTILEALRAEAKKHNRASYDRVLSRLENPTPPADLLSDIHDVLARRSAGLSAFTGARDARECRDMAQNLTVALRKSAILDPGLARQIDSLESAVPRNIEPEDARRLAGEAQRIDALAEDVRKRAQDDRIETRNLLQELAGTLVRAQQEVGAIDALAADPVRVEIEAALAIADRLSNMANRDGVELVDVRSRSAMDPLTAVCHRGTFDAALADAVRRSQTTNKPLSLLGDLDNFTRVGTWLSWRFRSHESGPGAA